VRYCDSNSLCPSVRPSHDGIALKFSSHKRPIVLDFSHKRIESIHNSYIPSLKMLHNGRFDGLNVLIKKISTGVIDYGSY